MVNLENWEIGGYEFKVECDGRKLAGDFSILIKSGHRLIDDLAVFDETDEGEPIEVKDSDLHKKIRDYLEQDLAESSHDYELDEEIAHATRGYDE